MSRILSFIPIGIVLASVSFARAETVLPRKPIDIQTGEFAPRARPSRSAYGNGAVADADALRAQRRQRQQQFQSVNSMNPASDDFGVDPATALSGPLGQLQSIAAQPMVQKMTSLALDPKFQESVRAIDEHPNRFQVLYWQLGWLVFVLALKLGLAVRARRTWVRIANLLWTSGVYVAGALVGIPWVVLGDSYWNLMKGLLRVLGG